MTAAITALVLQVDFNWSGMGYWDRRDLRQQRESA